MDNHWLRCNLLEQLGDKMKALKGYTQMLKYLGDDQGMVCAFLFYFFTKFETIFVQLWNCLVYSILNINFLLIGRPKTCQRNYKNSLH